METENVWAEIIIAGIENALLLDRLANNNQLIRMERRLHNNTIILDYAP